MIFIHPGLKLKFFLIIWLELSEIEVFLEWIDDLR